MMKRTTLASITLWLLFVSPSWADSLDGDLAFSNGNYAAAYRAWMADAQAGDTSAMAAIGTLYDTGHGVQQDFAAALFWYRKAAEAGDPRAMFNVGGMYDNGRGTAVDRKSAVKWYGMAAARGNGRAAYNLGVIYRDGDGVARSRAEAIRYFRIAAGAGIRAALPNLAALHASPPAGVPAPAAPDRPPVMAHLDPDSVAFGRFQQAALARSTVDPQSVQTAKGFIPILAEQANTGNSLAQYDIGFAYEHGIAMPLDPVKAYVFYLRASTSAEDKVKAAAMRGAADTGRQLDPAQHAAARGMLLEIVP